MTPRPRSRLLFRLAPLLVAAFVLVPGMLTAQAPTKQPSDYVRDWGARLAANAADLYAQAREYRDRLIARADEANRQTRALLDRRRRYEREAVGEIGRLGDPVPDWRERASVCEIDVDGEDVCTQVRHLAERFEEPAREWIDTTYASLLDISEDVDDVAVEVQDQVEEYMAGYMSRGAEWVLSEVGGSTFEDLSLFHDAAYERSTTYTEQEAMAKHLNELIDESYAHELENEDLSSGRARQIHAHVAIVEAEAMAEGLLADIEGIQAAAVATSHDVRGVRAGRNAVLHSLRGL